MIAIVGSFSPWKYSCYYERLLDKSKGTIIEIDSNTVKQAIMRMKNGRAAGPGDIPIELIKSTVYVLLGISPASTCDMPTFRNHVSVPSSKAGSRHVE